MLIYIRECICVNVYICNQFARVNYITYLCEVFIYLFFTFISLQMDLKDKINKIIQSENLNSAQFAFEIGIQGSTLSHIINGRNKPSLEVVQKILNRYNKINPDWLISDSSVMFRTEMQSQSPSLFDNIDENISKPIDYTSKNEQKFVPRNDTVQNKILNVYETPAQEIQTSSEFTAKPLETASKIVKKIIVYYSDSTFQELETK